MTIKWPSVCLKCSFQTPKQIIKKVNRQEKWYYMPTIHAYYRWTYAKSQLKRASCFEAISL